MPTLLVVDVGELAQLLVKCLGIADSQIGEPLVVALSQIIEEMLDNWGGQEIARLFPWNYSLATGLRGCRFFTTGRVKLLAWYCSEPFTW
jgi:hypothetical protein